MVARFSWVAAIVLRRPRLATTSRGLLTGHACFLFVELAPTVGGKLTPRETPSPELMIQPEFGQTHCRRAAAIAVGAELSYPMSFERAFAFEILAADSAPAAAAADS